MESSLWASTTFLAHSGLLRAILLLPNNSWGPGVFNLEYVRLGIEGTSPIALTTIGYFLRLLYSSFGVWHFTISAHDGCVPTPTNTSELNQSPSLFSRWMPMS